MKKLYTFEVNKKEKVEERIETEEGASIKYIDKDVPFEVYLKLPDRKDRADWAVIYNVEFNKALAMGLQPIEFLEKCMQANCGDSTKRDSDKIADIFGKLVKLANEIKLLEYEQKTEELTAKTEEYTKLSNEYMELERPYKELQSKSAEFYAQDKTVAWCVFHLTYSKEGERLFDGDSFEDKLSKFYQLDEESHLYNIFNKAYVCFYSAILGNLDLKNLDYCKQYFDEITA